MALITAPAELYDPFRLDLARSYMAIMCFGGSKQDNPEARKNADIEKQLRADQKKSAREVKMLLLGERDVSSR